MFNATALLKQWNLHTQKNEYLKKKDLDDFWKLTHLDKLMKEIVINERNLSSVKSTDDNNILDFSFLKNTLSKTSKANRNLQTGSKEE